MSRRQILKISFYRVYFLFFKKKLKYKKKIPTRRIAHEYPTQLDEEANVVVLGDVEVNLHELRHPVDSRQIEILEISGRRIYHEDHDG
jgi:hypothetical protein